jgi:hypothetical protein
MTASSAAFQDGLAAAMRRPALPPADSFYCRLDDQPGFLVPARVCEAPQIPVQRLQLNPHCWWSGIGQPPAAIRKAAAYLGLRRHGDEEVWVGDELRGAWLPFSVGPRFSSILHSLLAMGVPPTAIDNDAVRVLRAACILIDPDEQEATRTKLAADWAHRASEYAARGYAALDELLHPFHLGALRRYFRQRVRAGAFSMGDQTSKLRFVAHNEPIARFFHELLTPVVSAIAGEPLKPSYVYFSAYCGGATLRRHIDRPQCAHSVTFLLDYTPEPELKSSWPLLLHPPDGRVAIHQAIGEGLMYRGPVIPHERDALDENASSTSIFFHYVSRDFSGTLD